MYFRKVHMFGNLLFAFGDFGENMVNFSPFNLSTMNLAAHGISLAAYS